MRLSSLLRRMLVTFVFGLVALWFTTDAWATDVTLRLVDQNGALIPASQFEVLTPPGGTVQNGGTISLPDGTYSIRLYPGLDGSAQTSHLHRDEIVTVSGSTQTVDFVWVTATLRLQLFDQNNVLYPACQFHVVGTDLLTNDASVVFPVTDDPNTTPISGTYANGYEVTIFPGIDGRRQAHLLQRTEPAEELTSLGLVRTFTWEIATGSLHVVDISENEVNGALIDQPFLGTISTGASVSLPVTDNALYPAITGIYANGYNEFYIQTAPSNSFTGPFTFELLLGEIFDPAFVAIDGAQYGLRFDLQSAPVCVNPPSGLVSWWPGDGNANDIQGSNHGTLQNGAMFAAGKVGQAFSFDGVNDFVEIPENGSLDLNNEFSMEAWINPSEAPGNIPIPIASKYNYANGSYPSTSYELSIFDGGKVQFGITCGTNTMYKHTANIVVQANLFTHVAAIYRINPTPSLEIYVNGVEVAGTTFGQNCNYINQNDTPFRIGMRIDSQSSAFFAGLIDEVSIFNRALSASEIQSIYTAGSAGKCKECTPPEVSITGTDPVCLNTTHIYTAITNANDARFEWSVTGGMIDGDNTGSSVSVIAGDAGTMTVSVEVTDGVTNCSNSATQEVTVEDTEAPVITAAATTSLWPPNHKYVTINLSQCVVAVSDNCASLATSNVIISKVTSDEPEDAPGGGDGNTTNDIVIASDCQSVQLRSERQGSGNGRVYTIHLSISDGNGNTGTATCLVTVPKSQNGNPATDDGPVYTVNGSCNGGSSKLAGQDFTQETLPEGYALEQNYPNPFNPSTSIAFSVKEAGLVQLTIYNIHGQEVRVLVNGQINAGFHSVNWDGKDERGQVLPSGVYLYKLRVNGFAQTRKMTLMK